MKIVIIFEINLFNKFREIKIKNPIFTHKIK